MPKKPNGFFSIGKWYPNCFLFLFLSAQKCTFNENKCSLFLETHLCVEQVSFVCFYLYNIIVEVAKNIEYSDKSVVYFSKIGSCHHHKITSVLVSFLARQIFSIGKTDIISDSCVLTVRGKPKRYGYSFFSQCFCLISSSLRKQ